MDRTIYSSLEIETKVPKTERNLLPYMFPGKISKTVVKCHPHGKYNTGRPRSHFGTSRNAKLEK